MSSGIEDFGSMNYELFGFLVLAWVIVYFCIWRSVKTTGKVVMFTATFPYLLLIAFLIRGCTLPGAMEGIRYFAEPQWDQMLQSKVWIYAASQVFNSVGIGEFIFVDLQKDEFFFNWQKFREIVYNVQTNRVSLTCYKNSRGRSPIIEFDKAHAYLYERNSFFSISSIDNIVTFLAFTNTYILTSLHG